MKTLLIRLQNLGYPKAPTFVEIQVEYKIETVENTFCVALLGDSKEKVSYNLFEVSDIESLEDKYFGALEHIKGLVTDYLLTGDTATPTGGMLNGYQLVCKKESAIHKNMIRLDKFARKASTEENSCINW